MSLNCEFAKCLDKASAADSIFMVEKNGKFVKFTGNLDDIKTFDDCKKAGFPIFEDVSVVCLTRNPDIVGFAKNKNVFYSKEVGKTCEDYHYSTCPGSCVAKCTASSCSKPDENGAVACTSDCDGKGLCFKIIPFRCFLFSKIKINSHSRQ